MAAKFLKGNRIIPVVTIDNSEYAAPLVQALLNGGINIVEITLRTAAALEAIKIINANFPDCIVGAGTILTTYQFKQAKSAGAKFAVSPGLSAQLVKAAHELDMPYLPGVSTVSEIIHAVELDLELLKFFPAELFGGIKALKTFAPLFQSVSFSPSGGITIENMAEYLAQPNVCCIGGSWIASQKLINEQAWDTITQRAKEAIKK